jgi:lysophospholipase L1-like esterase
MQPIPVIRLFALSLLIAAPLPAQTAPAPAADAFFFRDGDTPAVLLGDSITQQRMYTTLIETYTLSRFPGWKITFRNTGWNGDTAWLSQRGDFDAGLKRDVLSLQPKAVTIDFGMNDARGGDLTYPKYIDYSTRLVEDLKKAGARVALITPSPEERYETDAPAGSHYNLMLKKYSDGLKAVAASEKVPFVDQYTPFVAAIEAGRKAGLLGTDIGAPNLIRLTNEGIHPNWGGHLIMATAILQGLHAPAMVSSLTLDGAGHAITALEGCTAELQDAPDGAIQFKRADRALPWPVPEDPSVDVALKIPGFDPATALNQYELTVTGLTAPAYKLTIDGKDIDTYTAADLAKGVNLGFMRQGPIFDQEQLLAGGVLVKNDAYFALWRMVQIYQAPDWMKKVAGLEEARKAEITRLTKVISDDEKAIDALRQPVPHIFRLEPVTK